MPRGIPNTAKNNPVNLPGREIYTGDTEPPEPPMPDLDNRGETVIVVDAEQAKKEQLENLAFNEEPMTIRLEPGNEENPPMFVPCWVNGRGAEVWDPNARKWLNLEGLPVGKVVITKRKYVEVLARSRIDKYSAAETNANPQPGQDGWTLRPSSRRNAVFSVIKDANPRGEAWLNAVLAER